MKSKQPKREKAAHSGGAPQSTRLEQGHAAPAGSQAKLAEPVVCSTCKAIYRDGRWVWPQVPNPTGRHTLCPACERIRDHRAGGEIRISGEFARKHRDEVLARARHVEEREKSEHVLQRIIEVREDGDDTVVTTTDSHLAHAIGTALRDAFKGELVAPWVEQGELMRVHWTR